MPSACFHVFSGTGNSAHAASIIQQRLEQGGYTTRVLNVDCDTIPPLERFDLHVFTFPVYSLDIPDLMLRYMNRLPEGNGVSVAVVATKGKLYGIHKFPGDSGEEGGAVEHARRVLTKKGYSVILTDAVSFPSNVTFGLLSAAPGEVPEIIRLAEIRVNTLADSLASMTPTIKRYNPVVSQAWMVIALLFRWIVRRFIGKMFIADSHCTSCGTCVKTCPAKAIRLVRGKPRWNYQCEGCQRCINTCPRNAIEASAVRGVTMFALLGLIFVPYGTLLGPVFSRFGLFIPSSGIFAILFTIVCWIICYFTSFFIMDVGLSILERSPLNCPIALFGYTRGASRYNGWCFMKKEKGTDEK